MTRSMRALTMILAAFAGALVACGGASSGAPATTTATKFGDVQVRARFEGVPVQTLVIEVAAGDIQPTLYFNLQVQGDGTASGTLRVKAGPQRTFTARAFDSSGAVTHEGTRTIDVVPGPNPPLDLPLRAQSGTVPVNVGIYDAWISVTPTSLSLEVGQSYTIQAQVLDNGVDVGTSLVVWSTSNPGVLSVDSNGVVTALAPGQAVVTAVYDVVAAASVVTVGGGGGGNGTCPLPQSYGPFEDPGAGVAYQNYQAPDMTIIPYAYARDLGAGATLEIVLFEPGTGSFNLAAEFGSSCTHCVVIGASDTVVYLADGGSLVIDQLADRFTGLLQDATFVAIDTQTNQLINGCTTTIPQVIFDVPYGGGGGGGPDPVCGADLGTLDGSAGTARDDIPGLPLSYELSVGRGILRIAMFQPQTGTIDLGTEWSMNNGGCGPTCVTIQTGDGEYYAASSGILDVTSTTSTFAGQLLDATFVRVTQPMNPFQVIEGCTIVLASMPFEVAITSPPVCAVPAEFVVASPIAGSYTLDPDLGAVSFDGDLNADPDRLRIELFPGFPPFEGGVMPGTYDLSSQSDYATCGACVSILPDYSGTWGSDRYLAVGGSLTVSVVDGARLAGSLTDVQFAHVTIDPQTWSTTQLSDCASFLGDARFDSTPAP